MLRAELVGSSLDLLRVELPRQAQLGALQTHGHGLLAELATEGEVIANRRILRRGIGELLLVGAQTESGFIGPESARLSLRLGILRLFRRRERTPMAC